MKQNQIEEQIMQNEKGRVKTQISWITIIQIITFYGYSNNEEIMTNKCSGEKTTFYDSHKSVPSPLVFPILHSQTANFCFSNWLLL